MTFLAMAAGFTFRHRSAVSRSTTLPVLLLLWVSLPAIVSSQTWVSALKPAALDDNLEAVAETPGRRFVVVGISKNGEHGDDGLIAVLDAKGDVSWSSLYGGLSTDLLRTVLPLPGGDLLAAGSTNSFGDGIDEAWVTRVNGAGEVQWAKTFGADGEQTAVSLGALAGESVLVGGRTFDFSRSSFLVWKIDEGGNVIWQHTYGIDSESEFLRAIVPTPDDGALLVGTTTYGEDFQDNALAVKIDSAGSIEWQRMYGMDGDENFFAVSAADSGFVAAGEAGTGHSGLPRGLLVRLSSGGDVVWHREYPVDSLRGGRLFAVTTLPDGSVVAAGEYFTVGFQTPDGWIIAVDGSDGRVLWQKTYGAFDLEQIKGLVCRENRGCTFAGITRSYSPGPLYNYNDAYVIRSDAEGEVSVECTVAHPQDDPGEVLTLVDEPYPGVVGELQDFTVTAIDLRGVPTSTPREEICTGTALFPPTEVSPPESLVPLLFTDATHLEWEDAGPSASETFDLYRGDVAELSTGSAGECLATGLTQPAATDEEQPAAGAGWFYLVGGSNGAGRGPLGVASDGSERQVAGPCP